MSVYYIIALYHIWINSRMLFLLTTPIDALRQSLCLRVRMAPTLLMSLGWQYVKLILLRSIFIMCSNYSIRHGNVFFFISYFMISICCNYCNHSIYNTCYKSCTNNLIFQRRQAYFTGRIRFTRRMKHLILQKIKSRL